MPSPGSCGAGCYGMVPTVWRIRGAVPSVLRPVRMRADGGPAADSAFAAAIAGLCQHSTPYHLARGLLDYAEYISDPDGDEAAGAIIGEARDIAGCLRCQPLLDRAADLLPAEPQIRAPS
jgi:hypothetical protein